MKASRQVVTGGYDGAVGLFDLDGGRVELVGYHRHLVNRVVVEEGGVRTRLLTAREAARLMGLPEAYALPRAATAALHVAGDGVAVPVVRWLAQAILEPLLEGAAVLAAE